MKKTFTLLMAVLFCVAVSAQTKQGNHFTGTHLSPVQIPIVKVSDSRAAGDTLLYMPLDLVFVNPTDSAAFNIQIEDQDGLPTNNAGADVDFGVYYSLNTDTNASGAPTADNFYHPWEDPLGGDSTFFWWATSWFNPAGVANNWLMFGPITLPGPGGTLMWYERHNPAYRDGYKVLATTTFSPTVTFTDFADPFFYSLADAYPSPTYITDTTWVLRTITIPSMYDGQVIYLAFNHDANDMDVLHLDEITIVESPTGIASYDPNENHLFQNSPNPFGKQTRISYSLSKTSDVVFDIYDITGRKVMTINEGKQLSGKHTLTLDSKSFDEGVYFYTMTANDKVQTKRMIVSK